MSFSTPVALLIFNRPRQTARVFQEIRRVQPQRLLIVADGPRPDRIGEAADCEAARAAVARVDWPCEVMREYSDVNLGCKRRVISGLDWVFKHCEEVIILEDDCLPDTTFFRFCHTLLQRYREDERIGVISGDNFHAGKTFTDDSYYFSRYPFIWGWASWRRVWALYDGEMGEWSKLRDADEFYEGIEIPAEKDYWRRTFDMAASGAVDTWDYQLIFSIIRHKHLCVVPEQNLVTNIGFGESATHTHDPRSPLANQEGRPLAEPLVHPKSVTRNRAADTWNFTNVYASAGSRRPKTLRGKIRAWIRQIVRFVPINPSATRNPGNNKEIVQS